MVRRSRRRLIVANISTRRRRRNRANRATRINTGGGTDRALVPVGPAMQRTFPIPRNRMARGTIMNRNRRSMNRNPLSMLSEPGLAFLKCAYASPDFSVDPGKGIPDRFQGRTVSIKDCFSTDINFTPDKDTYIIVAPVPGIAYFKAETEVGAEPTTFYAVGFPSAVDNFGGNNPLNSPDTIMEDCNYSKFRYASLAAGLYSTSNYMSFGGSVSVWKVDVSLGTSSRLANIPDTVPVTGSTDVFTALRINGLESIQPLEPRDAYKRSFQDGAFAVATQNGENFDWCEFNYALEYTNRGHYPGTGVPTLGWKTLAVPDSSPYMLPGLGSVDTIVYKVSTPAGASNTAAFRVWNCIEVLPKVNTNVYQFSGVSPSHDPIAMELYHKMKTRIPVAVPAKLNDTMWDRITKIMYGLFAAGAGLPGGFGMASAGMAGVVEGIRMLTVY